MKTVLSIAGFDPSGGSGILADARVCSASGVYSIHAITALVVENPLRVDKIVPTDDEIIQRQLQILLEVYRPTAIKIGMIYSKPSAKVISKYLRRFKNKAPIIIDPILIASSGKALIKKNAVEYIIKKIFPLADVLTPNITEAGFLLGEKITQPKQAIKAAKKLEQKFNARILLKGGHLKQNKSKRNSEDQKTTDFFCYKNKISKFHSNRKPQKKSADFHGTGCTLSTAIAVNLALNFNGKSSQTIYHNAVKSAKKFTSQAIAKSIKLPNTNFATLNLQHNF